MLTKLLTLILIFAVSVFGCSAANIYEEVAAELVEEYVPEDSFIGHVGMWAKSGGQAGQLTAAEEEQASSDLAECAIKYQQDSNYVLRTTRRSVAAVQLLDCMESKGWSYSLIETVATGP